MEHIRETAETIRNRLANNIAQSGTLPGPTPPNNRCSLCGGARFIQVQAGVVRCQCQRDAQRQSKLREIPERFRACSLSNYTPRDFQQKAAWNAVAGNVTGCFFLHGGYARGKTHLATAQYRKLVELDRSCLLFTMGELVAELMKADLDQDYFCEVRHRARYAAGFHLFVDDIDKFRPTEYNVAALFDLINTLYKRNLGLTVTSNYNLRALSERNMVHPAIVRRLDDMCKALEV
jgi:DNA replication protein DnaC